MSNATLLIDRLYFFLVLSSSKKFTGSTGFATSVDCIAYFVKIIYNHYNLETEEHLKDCFRYIKRYSRFYYFVHSIWKIFIALNSKVCVMLVSYRVRGWLFFLKLRFNWMYCTVNRFVKSKSKSTKVHRMQLAHAKGSQDDRCIRSKVVEKTKHVSNFLYNTNQRLRYF